MPRIARTWGLVAGSLLATACSFHADYGSGSYTCRDGKCPAGLVCSANHVCVGPGSDAGGGDGAVDGVVDAPPAALTCVDPGPFPAAGGTTMGTTAGRSNTVSALCGGVVENGADAVYRVDTGVGARIQVSISGSYPVAAYVIAPCTIAPSTPACEGDAAASAGNPIAVTTTFAGQHFVVVDGANAGLSGTYTLTVQVTP
jgi:hypothetical protein